MEQIAERNLMQAGLVVTRQKIPGFLVSLVFVLLLASLISCDGGAPERTPIITVPPEDSCPVSSLNKPSAKLMGQTTASGSILVFSATAGYRHDSIAAGRSMLQSLAASNGWAITLSEDASDFNESTLANYDVVVWLNTTGDVLSIAQQTAFENYIESGGGYLGIHSAADTEYNWPWYGELVGAWFISHPDIQSASLNVENDSHLSTSHLSATWQHTDEWYNFQSNPRANVNVLLSLNENSYDPGENPMGDHPIAWYHTRGQGRAFYTGLGHSALVYNNENFVRHIEGGLRWAGRMDKNVQVWTGDPPPDTDFRTTTLASSLNEPMMMEISKAGEIFVIGRNGEFYAMDDGSLLPKSVFTTNSSNEGGLIGFALDPDFAENRRAYFHYSAQSVAENRVSRININSDNTLDFSSEQILLTYSVDLICCHAAGDMAFDSEGNLFIATGDNTDPFESDGYTPIDERAGRQLFDAQRTAANTNDLRGKILRIFPEDDGSYSIPAGNLFVADATHRGEIFSMGHRNPFRIHVDTVSDWLYWGDIGADAGGSNSQRGPGGTDEINRTVLPGNFGWPYFTGMNEAYNDYNFATTTSGAKFSPLAVENFSPNNTGANMLPNALPAWISMSHRALMVADVYHWNESIDDEYKLPSYFHKRLLYWNFNNDRLYEVSTLEDQPVSRQWLNTAALAGIIDAEISPQNNRLYLLGYGGNCCDKPTNAGMLVEVQYRGNGPGNPQTPVETFEVGDTINLHIDGSVVSATSAGELAFVSAGFDNDEVFEIVDAGDGAVALRSVSSGLYLSAGNGGNDPLTVNSATIGKEQQFKMQRNSSGLVSLQAYVNCNYVSLVTSGDDSLVANSSTFGTQELFSFSYAKECKTDATYGLACRTSEAGSPAWLSFPDSPDANFTNVPTLLSQTGAFIDLVNLTPDESLIPYDVISPLWSDRAEKQRWISVPAGGRVVWSEHNKWVFPAGTVFIKHFALPIDESNPEALRRLETRFIVVQESGAVYGLTYKWREDNSDADLLMSVLDEDITVASESGDWQQTWTYPGPDDCLTCHNADTKYILGVKTAALNKSWQYPTGTTDNQLRTLINLGIFSSAIDEQGIANFPAHAALDDSAASLEQRVRSYWDINCGNCHGPQGIAAHWDARFSTPLGLQGIVYGLLADQRDYFADYGLDNPFVIDPDDINNSILYLRSKSVDVDDRMPPLGRHLEDTNYINVLEQWINSLQ